MKVSVLQLLLASILISGAYAGDVLGQEILEKRISLEIKSGSLRAVLSQIEKIVDVKFLFRSQLIPAKDKISIQVNQERLSVVLDQILNGRNIRYEADGNQIVLTKVEKLTTSQSSVDYSSSSVYAATISGQVKDETGQPLPGANIIVKGTTNGTTSDADGRYILNVEDQNATLVFSFIGYTSQEILVGNQKEINVSLKSNVDTLSEVIVVGYGTQKKEDVIGSVSSLEGSDLNIKSITNMEASLQGLSAGVSVQSQSGAPGAPVRVLIRGANSIGLSTDPLYVIDGMPISVPSAGVGSSNQGPMSLINPNDIERIDILKDAAATSIYGSRASNGVVIVTTKSGRKGEGRTTFNYSTGFSRLTRTPDDVGFVNTKQWFATMDQAYKNSGLDFSGGGNEMIEYYKRVPLATIPLASPQLTRAQAESVNTNWFNELFGTGVFNDYNLSSSKSTENTSFFLSGNYRKDNGVQKNNNLERVTVRSNLDFKPTKNLKISSKLTFGYTKNDQRPSGITSISVNALPWLPIRELNSPNRYYNPYVGSNAVALSDPANVLNRVEQYRGLGGLSVNYQLPFVPGLTLKTEISGDIIQSNIVNWQSRDIRLNGDNTAPQSAATEESVTFVSINYNAYASYDKAFGVHDISAIGGVEATRSSQKRKSATGIDLTGNYQELGVPSQLLNIYSRLEGERYLLGYFGRVNYKFKQRYLAGLSVRQDGSSVFTSQNRWGTFFAASAGWILSDESFMSFLGNGVFLKLRGSYGETGNQYIPNGLNVSLYNTQPLVYGSRTIGGVNGTVPINVAVQNLKWETTRSSDVGIDFGLFSNRLSGSLAYYHRLIDQQFLQAPVPLSVGLSSQFDLQSGQGSYDRSSNSVYGNFGSMVNSGVEVELHSVNLDHNGFKWTTDFNIAFNRNEITSLSPDIDKTGSGLLNISGNAISRKGDRRGVWFIADYAGVNPNTGVPLIYKRDEAVFAATGETKREQLNGDDVLIPGNIANIQNNRFYQNGKSGDPKYQGGITNTFRYKGFDASVFVVFSGGNYILDYDRQLATVINPTGNILREVYDQSWKAAGDVAKYPQLRANFTYNVNGSTDATFSGANAFFNRELYKGDYIRLRNIQIGYSIPSSTVERIKMKNIRFYVSGSNLFTITDYPGFDPEGTGTGQVPGFVYYANAIPQLKTFTIGLDISF